MSRVINFLALLFALMFFAHPVQAADFTVGTGTAASCNGAAFDTALASVQNSGGGTLIFNCGGAATINFTAGKVISAAAVTIDGGNQITLNGANVVRHFYVEANANFTIRNITLTNGFDNTYGGGSILSLGGLTLDNVTIRDSNVTSDYSGGAIMAHKPVTITNSLLENNTGGSVGGLYLFGEAADATITDSTFRNNRTTNDTYGLGGALTTWNGADVTIRSSTFEQNQARLGGAIYNESGSTTISIEMNSILHNNTAKDDGGCIYNSAGDVTLAQVTLSGNSSLSDDIQFGFGGGIHSSNSNVSLTHITFSGNINTGDIELSAAGIDHFSFDPITGVAVRNVIFQGMPGAGANCHLVSGSTSPITSLGFNLSSDDSCPLNQAGDQNNIVPMLGPLADNGGPTQTHMPLSGSPAIDAGQCGPNLTTDQRGLPRLQGLACDIGAVERQPNEGDSQTFLPLLSR